MERAENSLVGAGVTGKGEQTQLPRQDPVRAAGTRPDHLDHSKAHGLAATVLCEHPLPQQPETLWKGQEGTREKKL